MQPGGIERLHRRLSAALDRRLARTVPASRRTVAFICLLAIALRVAYRAYAGSADFWEHGYTFFYDIATNIAAGKGVGIDGGASAMRPPVYPGFLALAYVEADPGAALTGALRKIAAGFSWVMSPRREPLVQRIYFLSYAPISILGLLGMVLARRAWRVHSLIYLQFLAFVAVSAIFWAHTSHRTYLDVYLIVFSVFAAERLFEFATRRAAEPRHRAG
jgi:hypothetical protein